MVDRPYINCSAKEIKDAVETNNDNLNVLQQLVFEIGFRKKGQKKLAPALDMAQQIISAQLDTTKESPAGSVKNPMAQTTGVHNTSQSNSIALPLGSEIPREPNQAIKQSSKKSFLPGEDVSKIIQTPIKSSKPANNTPNSSSISRGEMGNIRPANIDLKGVPNVWTPDIKETFTVKGLSEAVTNAKKYSCLLGALIWEIRKGSKFSKVIQLKNGKKQTNNSGEHGSVYSFIYTDSEDLFEGSRIDVQIGSKKVGGALVSLLNGQPRTLIISLDEDCGSHIKICMLTQDEAALLESLQNRLDLESGGNSGKAGTAVGMNIDLADKLIAGLSDILPKADYKYFEPAALNLDQKSFVKKAVSHSVSFLWGPPGTGKTKTLGAIAANFYKDNERTHICSNTNQAVDQVILKLCNELTTSSRQSDLEDGKIIRLGQIQHKVLFEKYNAFVSIDGIVERKGSTISKQIAIKENELLSHERNSAKNNEVLEKFNNLDDARARKATASKEIGGLTKKIQNVKDEVSHLTLRLNSLSDELLAMEKKGRLGRVFSRSPDSIKTDIKVISKNKKSLIEKHKNLSRDLDNARSRNARLIDDIKNLESMVKGKSLSDTKKFQSQIKELIIKSSSELKILQAEIKNLRRNILSQAKIIGTTLTKSFLSPGDIGKFENVIIDEASMGLLPAVYFTASQAKKRCIISGDFRQLKPIVQSNNKTILDNIGIDIFSASRIEAAFESKNPPMHAGMLGEQYRMDPMICDLISNLAYANQLNTSKDRKVKNTASVELFKKPVVIIDTSTIYPFTDRDPFGSTSNIIHALIARNIMRTFHQTYNTGTIGYCAPFKAQTRLLKKLSSGEGYEDNAAIGTVHTFQGDEKNTLIFDTVNSLGEKHYLNPNLAQESASKSNLLTVAISRAENCLIFIANLRYLDDKIPAMGFLRHVLYSAQQEGQVIDARTIIDLAPIKDEFEELTNRFHDLDIPADALQSGLVTEDVFFPLLKTDLLNAKQNIAIYSGFYTANRIRDLFPVLIPKIKSGVKVKIIVPPPERNGSMSESDSEQVIQKLENHGVLVEFRAKIHQKAILIDSDTVWFGSLNPLSFSGNTEESMLRVEKPNITGVFSANMAINRESAKGDSTKIASPELPPCSYCKSNQVVFKRGRWGAYIDCRKCKKTGKLHF
jgi:phosphatidylserine/phosphatidylglycerophosphate/cardiolipin synthase-like enzyme